MQMMIKLLYQAITNFSTQLLICELMLCIGLRRRPMFWARILVLYQVRNYKITG